MYNCLNHYNDLEYKANSIHSHSEYCTNDKIIDRFKALQTIQWTIISESNQTVLNCPLESCSGYLVFAMQDVNGDTSDPVLMFVTTSNTAVKTITSIYGDSSKLFTMIPTSGLLIGFYPGEDYYIHFSMIKIY